MRSLAQADYASAPSQTYREDAPRQTAIPDTVASVDYDGLLTRCMGDLNLLVRVVEKFQSRSQQNWEKLLDGYRSGDAQLTAQMAHSIKGAASNLSAVKLSGLAEQLEELGKAGNLVAAQSVVDQLGEEFAKCEKEMRELAARHGQPLAAATAR